MPDGLNKVMLIGNLGTDPEMRYTANGSAVTTFRIAVSRSYAGEEGRREETEWFIDRHLEQAGGARWASTCRRAARSTLKEDWRTRSWDGPDGQKRYRTEVVANQVLFLDRPQGAPFGDGGAGMPSGGDMDPDDLPFE